MPVCDLYQTVQSDTALTFQHKRSLSLTYTHTRARTETVKDGNEAQEPRSRRQWQRQRRQREQQLAEPASIAAPARQHLPVPAASAVQGAVRSVPQGELRRRHFVAAEPAVPAGAAAALRVRAAHVRGWALLGSRRRARSSWLGLP